MNQRSLAFGTVAAAVLLGACVDPESGGDQNNPTAGNTAERSGSRWQHPMTEWGDPDLRGTWPIQHLIGTPFQRDEEYGERETYSEEEYQSRLDSLEERNTRYEEEIRSNRMGMGHWAETTDALQINSLLVDPPDGQFPELTAAGKAMSEEMGSSWTREIYDSVADFDTWDRCITRGLPPSMFPFNYNNGIEIHQAPGYVVVRLEMIHEARIIPVFDAEPLEPEITQWMGDSRGRWEGNTLVVETTNFNGLTGMTNVGIPGSPREDTPTTKNMRIVERFERISDDQINYSMTVEDPEVLTQPWTARYPAFLDNSYQFFEYACHEDNTAVRNFIETSRYERAQQAAEGASE
jgi:hypothetical protein